MNEPGMQWESKISDIFQVVPEYFDTKLCLNVA